MKKLVLLATVFITLGASRVFAKSFGLGIILGEPTGISMKYWLSDTTAIDAAAAWSFGRTPGMRVHADFLIHPFLITSTSSGKLPFYVGVGPRLNLQDGFVGLGVRIPVGLTYLFSEVPIDLFFEVAPGMDLIPATGFSFEGGFGARYYF